MLKTNQHNAMANHLAHFTTVRKIIVSTISLSFVFALLQGCNTVDHKSEERRLLQSAPGWFKTRSVNQEKSDIIGYGYGANYEQSKLRALTDISQQLAIHLDSITQSNTHVINKRNGSHESYHQSKSTTHRLLSNAVEIQKSVNELGVFTAFSYKENSLVNKAVQLITKSDVKKCSELQQGEHNNYLVHTPFYRQLSKILNCLPAIKLAFHDELWRIVYLNDSVIFSEEKLWSFFVEVSSAQFNLELSSNLVYPNDLYRLNLHGKKTGFLSIVQVEQQGSMQLFLHNKTINRLTNKEPLIFPDNEIYQGLQANTTQSNNKTKELVIAALCNAPINLSPIDTINETSLPTNNRQLLPYFFEQIADCEVSSKFLTLVHTAKNQSFKEHS